jgi:Protein of unknown function (DUF2795)
MTSFQRAAELQVLLEGVPLPATRQELLEYAESTGGGGSFRAELERLPEREFRALDEVGEELAAVQPRYSRSDARETRAESGAPPGGAAYTDASAEPGWVRERGPAGPP